MHRSFLLNSLQEYKKSSLFFLSEEGCYKNFVEFVYKESDCFYAPKEGHVTGSCLVVDKEMKYVLLNHHRKLDKWLQFGGHSDGENLVYKTALREAYEESGLESIKFFFSDFKIFDIDIHFIPREPHYHFDVRYLACANQKEKGVVSSESKDIRWFLLEEAYRVATEPSMHRQFDKIKFLRNNNTIHASSTLIDLMP